MSSKSRAFSLGCVAAALSWSAQAAQVTLDFETIGLAAPSTGTAVLDSFKLNYGLSFSANAFAFHNGTGSGNDTEIQIPARKGNFGYVRSPFDAGGFTGFTILVDKNKKYDQFALTLGVESTPVEIYAYDASDNLLNSGKSSFASNTGNFTWTDPFTLVDGSKKANIDHITFNFATRGLFAIDDLKFTEAAGGGTVPEPAGVGLVALALAAAGVASRRGKSA